MSVSLARGPSPYHIGIGEWVFGTGTEQREGIEFGGGGSRFIVTLFFDPVGLLCGDERVQLKPEREMCVQ